MKTCPVAGCDVRIHDADVVCRGCLATVSRNVRDGFVAAWRRFRTHFDAASMDAYERAIRNVIVDAGQAKRSRQLPMDP